MKLKLDRYYRESKHGYVELGETWIFDFLYEEYITPGFEEFTNNNLVEVYFKRGEWHEEIKQ